MNNYIYLYTYIDYKKIKKKNNFLLLSFINNYYQNKQFKKFKNLKKKKY